MRIIELLNYFRKTKTHGMKFLHKVGIFLSNNLIGRRILDTQKEYDGYRKSLFYEKISNQDIHFILVNLKGDNIQKDQLLEFYEKINKIQKKTVECHMKPGAKFEYIENFLKLNCSSHKIKFKKNRTDGFGMEPSGRSSPRFWLTFQLYGPCLMPKIIFNQSTIIVVVPYYSNLILVS